jgi:hypothetical protein
MTSWEQKVRKDTVVIHYICKNDWVEDPEMISSTYTLLRSQKSVAWLLTSSAEIDKDARRIYGHDGRDRPVQETASVHHADRESQLEGESARTQ